MCEVFFMNKVFKVIWSEARNAYVVVSEMAKSHGTKSCSTKKLLAMLIATGVMTCASVAPAMAANPAPTDTKIEVGNGAKATGGDSVAIGNGAEAQAANGIAIGYESLSGDSGYGVAVGGNTQATGTHSVALGQTAKALEYEGIAIGHTSLSEGSGAIAIGKSTNAKGAASLAFGNDAKALEEASIAFGQDSKSSGNSSIAIGRKANATGQSSIAIGFQAVADKAYSVVIGANTYEGTTGNNVTSVGQQAQVLGDYSAAFGMAAQANKSFTSAIGSSAKATADCANAFGSNSTASAVWSVALGTNSVADRTSGYVGLYAPEDTNSLTWRANGGAVSVGSNGTLTRQITNVAAGSADTDAVNVAQLNAVKAAAGKKVSLVDGENTKATLVKDDATGTQYKVDVDLSKYAKTEDVAVVYDKNKTSLRSTNATLQTSSKEEEAVDSIALGKDASAVKESVAIGNGASVVEGSNGLGGVALGYKAHAGYKGTSLGSNAISGREGTTLVGANTNSGSLYTTVVGTDSVINSSGAKYLGMVNVQGATATVVGSKNTVDNQNNKVYSGVANNIMGAANTIKSSNGITIQGSGNTVTDAYKDMDIDLWGDGLAILGGDYSVLAKKQSGAIAVVGGANNVSKQTDSTVIGYDNKLTGDEEKGSHDVFMAGSHNRLNNVSDSIVMGNKNAITGVSNVISFSHQNEITANNAVAIGSGAGVSAEGGVALGAGSVADRANAVSVGSTGANRQIINVAAGTEGTDAVNVSQLQKVSDTANKGWNLATNGFGTEATNVKPGDYVDFSGDKNISVSHDGTNVKVELNDELKDIKSIIGAGEGAGSISFADGGIKLNNKVTINKDGKITGVAAGEVSSTSTDAINGSQLHAVATEAGKHTTLSNGKNTTVESTVKDGQTDYKVNVAGDLTDITSVANGDSKINLNKDSIIISNGNKYFAITNSGIGMSYIGADYSAKSIMLGENGTTISGGLNVAGSKITGVAAGEADTDAVNVGQLNAAVQAGNTDTHIKAGEYGVGTDNKVNMQLVDKNGKDAGTVTITDVAKASDVGNVNNIADDIKNGEGHTTVVDAVNNLNQKLDNKVGDLNYVEGGKGNYVTNGENTTTSIGKLDQALKDVADTANQGWNLSTNGGEASKVAPGKTVDFSGDKNIKISNDGTNVEVKLNEVIDVNTVTAKTVTTGNTVMNSDGVKVGADVSLNQNGLNVGKDVSVTATAVTAGKTSISDEGVKVGDKTYISADGLNANGQHITNVKAGEADTDAVNYGQLKDTNNRINGVENQVISNSNRINQLGNRVNKVGAGAAALAALHPMDFDPDDKLTFSAGYGNYGGENAAAIGAYYRPDEKVMFSVAGTVGNGENMVNAGVSFALDRTNHVSNSRTALAREVIDLRGQLAVMGAKMAKMEKAFGMLDETKTKLFPDVPANHWAYEYIAKLAGNGYIEGYPDGNFGGDRLMTRYEFAAMLYRAIEKGAALEEKIIKEFEPELGRIRVDRISGEDGDRDKIERVRVNDTKGERDHYGNKLAK